MSQYLENIEDYSLFDFLNPHPIQQSEFLSINSQPLSISPYNLQPSQKETKSQAFKKQLPTSDGAKQRPPPYPPSLSLPIRHQEDRINCQSDIWEINDRIRQGSKDDTVQLNINFKTIVFNHFKQLIQANELSHSEIQSVLLFGKRTPSFKSLQQFCHPSEGSRQVNKLCLSYVSSSLIVRNIMESRCKISTKLQMIKFVERLRSNISSGRIVKWKERMNK